MVDTAPAYNPSQTKYPNQGSIYIDELMNLYQQYIHEQRINKLLSKKIVELNSSIEKYIQDREKNSYVLFCVTDYDQALENIASIRQKSEFMLAALSFVVNATSDKKLNILISNSIDAIQKFIIKLIEFSEVYIELKSYEGEVDEDSDAYKDKIADVANLITNSNRRKAGNSIKELLGI